ncbi:MAG: NAD(P)H-dependent oxidoreductase [Bacteroidales bacterium]|nr:NAD(P)H-dependent oxidoreductase [Bacteroidales bacterium]
MEKVKIGLLIGSARTGSNSQSVANCIMQLMPDNYEVHSLKISHLPLYNQDYDADYPTEYREFKKEVAAMDAILIITPEHNRSIPALLKNALDIASRPAGQSVWGRKPVGIISHSPGPIGGFGANQHLRQVLSLLNMPTLQQPECYLGQVNSGMEEGVITNERTLAFLKDYVKAYTEWIDYMKAF